jgi:glucose-6-phosphate-specific signal transduction histidine kinase
MAPDTDQHAQLAVELQEVRAEMAQLAEQVEHLQEQIARLVASDADEGGDELITIREGASAVNVPYPTLCRWAKQNSEALGVEKFGARIYVSRRRLKFFANRRLTKF